MIWVSDCFISLYLYIYTVSIMQLYGGFTRATFSSVGVPPTDAFNSHASDHRIFVARAFSNAFRELNILSPLPSAYFSALFRLIFCLWQVLYLLKHLKKQGRSLNYRN